MTSIYFAKTFRCSILILILCSFIDHGDGLITLRLLEPLAIDSGIYTCIVTSEYGCCTTSNEVAIVEEPDPVREIVPEFVKELVPAVAMHGSVVSFCARVTPVTSKVKWFICGREINENTRGIMVSTNACNSCDKQNATLMTIRRFHYAAR